jgi:hypothetical protein
MAKKEPLPTTPTTGAEKPAPKPSVIFTDYASI